MNPQVPPHTDFVQPSVPVLEPSASRPISASTVRVLHVINGEHYSGAERVQDLLAACLPQEGFRVEFACLKPGRFLQQRQTVDAPLRELMMASRFDLRPAWRLAQLLRHDDFQLVHAHTPRSLLIAKLATKLTGKPLVYHVHSPAARDSTSRWQNWMNAANERFSLGGETTLVTVSESLGREMKQRGFAENRVHVVPNGVPAPQRKRSDQHPGRCWTIGCVALFRPRKGTEVLLDALARLKQQGWDVRFRAVGPFETAEYESQIRQQAAELGIADCVDWVGFSDRVPNELAQMDLLVLPSLFGEGLPMVVLEAMAAGVPVVGTRVEGVPEAVDHGVTGLLAEPGSVNDLAGCLELILSGELDWSLLRDNGLRRHAEAFSDRAMAQGVAAVYRHVLQ